MDSSPSLAESLAPSEKTLDYHPISQRVLGGRDEGGLVNPAEPTHVRDGSGGERPKPHPAAGAAKAASTVPAQLRTGQPAGRSRPLLPRMTQRSHPRGRRMLAQLEVCNP